MPRTKYATPEERKAARQQQATARNILRRERGLPAYHTRRYAALLADYRECQRDANLMLGFLQATLTDLWRYEQGLEGRPINPDTLVQRINDVLDALRTGTWDTRE